MRPGPFAILMPVAIVAAVNAGEIETASVCLTYDPARPAASFKIVNKLTSASFTVRTAAPEFQFEEGTVGGALEPARLQVEEQADAWRILLDYPPQTIGGCKVEIRSIFTIARKAPLVRKHAEISAAAPADARLTLKRVVLLDEPFAEPIAFQMDGWQSYPVFGEGFFFGVEFPVAQARAAEGRIRLAHAPGLPLNVPGTFRTHNAVIGVCPKGRAREAFEDYVTSFRPLRDTAHFNYNSWWTSPVPFNETDILGLIRTFEEKLYRAHGASFDTFTIDMGWSDPRGIWKISPRLFPSGFAPLNAELARQQSRLGLWWSPSNCYSPMSFDNGWASIAGYETLSLPRPNRPPLVLTCLGRGTKYQSETARNLGEIARQFKLGQLKFDGYHFECPVNTHGHLPGELSREAIASGLIEIFKALRQVDRDLWMETTCFGYDASPWWLEHVNSVIGPFGDDSPFGAVPAPIYRESYTTSRDFFNLHGSVTPVPIAAQEVLGIIHQTSEPMYNDAVTTVLRGHQFISLYLNPKFMADRDYAFLADLMEWTRANAATLARTKVIWPESWKKRGPAPIHDIRDMPRETYGYAHWRNGAGLLCLRNPWIAMDDIDVTLDEATLGMPADAAGTFAAAQIYPWRGCLAKGLKAGSKLSLRMGPYETRVIRFVPDSDVLQAAGDPSGDLPKSVRVQQKASGILERTTTSPQTQPFGDDYTVISSPQAKLWQVKIAGTTPGDGWRLYYLVESPPPASPLGEVEVKLNGTNASPQVIDSETGWAAQTAGKQCTWKWYAVPLPAGEWQAEATIETGAAEATVSAWLLGSTNPPATNPAVENTAGKPLLPLAPDYRPGISVQAIAMTKTKELPAEKRTGAAKIDRINGIYLDRLQPASATQGWGELRRNQSVWEKPLQVGTRRFARGLGTHANSRITYALDGGYKALHGYAGQDVAAGGSITMEIYLEGKKVWESGRMTHGDEAKPFSIPLGGAKELALIVTDAGDTYMGDHADWADVWLER